MFLKRCNKFICAMLVVALLFCCAVPRPQAHAEALTIAIVAGVAAAVAVTAGLVTYSVQNTGESLTQFWENKVNSYLAGRTLPQVFGDEVAQAVGGKLLVPATLYGHILDFVSDATDTTSTTPVSQYSYTCGGLSFHLDNGSIVSDQFTGAGVHGPLTAEVYDESGTQRMRFTLTASDGSTSTNAVNASAVRYYLLRLSPSSGRIYCDIPLTSGFVLHLDAARTDIVAASLDLSYPDGYAPTVVNPSQTWQGSVGGYSGPDTNLEQLLGHLFDEMADNNLEVEGEAIDTPAPPAPEPVLDLPFPNTIAGDFLEGLNDLLQDAAQGLENVGTGISQGISQGIGIVQQGLRDILGEISAFKQLLLQVTGDIANDISLVAEAALQIPQILQNILVDTGDILSHLLEDIELAPVHLFDSVLDVLKNILQPLLNRLRAGVGIWHYVVEWFSSISVPFYWVIAVTSQTGILAPAYALIAGSIVIAVYRRFGR